MSKQISFFSSSLLGALVVSVPLLLPVLPIAAQAQTSGALEEIIVTAQRREQSLQEVPISIETYSGADITKQGYRDMQELTNYSPTVTVNPDILRSSITIRGFGAASADALTIEQSSPTFVDGIHYGRSSQIKLAFMDLQSVEILKGPQPVYFGANAIAGAFNLNTRKPTPEWVGNLSAEFSNNNTQKVDFGTGGPITDTLGIRVAGTFERSDGFLRDIVTDNKFPAYRNYGGRVIFRWSPNEAFEATAKFEKSDMHKGPEGKHICMVPNGDPVTPKTSRPEKVLLDPPLGVGWDVLHKPLGECYASNDGITPSGKLPPPNNVNENGNTILLNINDIENLIPEAGFSREKRKFSYGQREDITPWNSYLDLKYTLDNGIELHSLTGYDHYLREYLRDNRGTPFYTNFQNREEDQVTFSEELRINSPTGGTIEWMAGAYYEDSNFDYFSDSIRPNNRTGRRYNEGYEDSTWKAVFGNLTFNFYEDKASIDLGGRYSNSKKETFVQGWGSQFIMFDGYVETWRKRRGPGSSQYELYNGTTPIGMTELTAFPDPAKPNAIPGPYTGHADKTKFDPQIVLRYRPTDEMSMYVKYAESFKAAGFNTGQATLPSTFEEYGFGPEYGKNYEAGIKGNLLDGSARYTVSVFNAEISDLQLAAALANQDTALHLLSFTNAGGQRTRGVEFTFDWAATDALVFNLAGAILDGVMLDYVAPCTLAEFSNPAESGCMLDADDPADGSAATIDRSGTQAPNTPDWKFVLNADYVMPLANAYEVIFNAKGYYSDGYITDTNGFSLDNKFNKHGDLSLQAGVGPQGGPWTLSVFARNLLEASESYNAEYDLEIPKNPIRAPVVYRSSYTTYGLTFRYSF